MFACMRFSNLRTVLGSTILVYGAGCGSVNPVTPDAATDSPPVIPDGAPDAPPAVPVNQMNEGTVAENGTLSLMNRLVTVDTDTLAGSLTYAVRSLPTDGVLKKDGTPLAIGMTFTQADVNSGKLTYEHDGAENSSDGFDWDLSDGVNTIPESGTNTFAITVTPVNDAPVIVNNPVSTVAEGGTFPLANADLQVSDIEGTAALTYTFVSITRGQLQKDDGTSTFVALAPNGTFTQQDIVDGKVRFVDPGTDDAMLAQKQDTTASFSWRVQDAEGGFNPSETGTNVKSFTVTSVDDAPNAVFFTSRCYVANTAVKASPLMSLSDPDDPASAYQVCIVAIGNGSSIVFSTTTQTIGTTVSVTPVVKNGTVMLPVNSCVAANALQNLTLTNSGTQDGGSVTWKLMKGATQIGPNHTVQFPVSPQPCP
jgi:hypothetical protein